MVTPVQRKIQNLLLKALPADAFDMIVADADMIELPLKQVLVEADEPKAQVYFIESGLASMVASNAEDEVVEVGHIRHEGMARSHVLLKTTRPPTGPSSRSREPALRCPWKDLSACWPLIICS